MGRAENVAEKIRRTINHPRLATESGCRRHKARDFHDRHRINVNEGIDGSQSVKCRLAGVAGRVLRGHASANFARRREFTVPEGELARYVNHVPRDHGRCVGGDRCSHLREFDPEVSEVLAGALSGLSAGRHKTSLPSGASCRQCAARLWGRA